MKAVSSDTISISNNLLNFSSPRRAVVNNLFNYLFLMSREIKNNTIQYLRTYT